MKNIIFKRASNKERVEFKMDGKVQNAQNSASKHELIQQQKKRKAQNFEAIKNNFKNILKKNECNDIFKDICKNKTLVYEQKDYSKFLKSKIKVKSRRIMLDKLRMLLNLKLLSGVVFIQTLLRRIELTKEIFVSEIEQGKEVFICSDLSQDQLPKSFRYYDSIL